MGFGDHVRSMSILLFAVFVVIMLAQIAVARGWFWKYLTFLANGFSFLHAAFFGLLVYATQRHCPDPHLGVPCLSIFDSLLPFAPVPFIVASFGLVYYGKGRWAAVIAALPAVVLLVMWADAASKPFGFGG